MQNANGASGLSVRSLISSELGWIEDIGEYNKRKNY